MPYVRREYLRALVNTGQVVINRAFLYNNPAIHRDTPGQERIGRTFKKLLNGRVVIPYLFAEPSPPIQPSDFTRRDAGWEGWRQVISESIPMCLRLSWESDEDNMAQARRLLATPSAQFIETVNYLESPLLAADLRLSADNGAALADRPERGRGLGPPAVGGRGRSSTARTYIRHSLFTARDGSQ